jgi:hypothetical protein
MALMDRAAASMAAPRRAGARQHADEPLLVLVLLYMTAGLLIVTAAHIGARQYADTQTIFWIGVFVLALPVAMRLLQSQPSRTERLLVVVAFALSFYALKLLMTPTRFSFHDEFAHWRTLHDIVTSHHLFVSNPLIPESGSYPGLEIVAGAVSQVTGLGLFSSGMLVVGIGRVILVLSIFLLVERAGGSARLASLATFFYAANPNFFYFDAQFAYESLALPLAALLVFLAVRPRPSGRTGYLAALVPLVVTGAALAVTHHLTSWILALALMPMFVVVGAVRRRRGDPVRMILPAAIIAVAAPLLWFARVGTGAIDYVTPHLAGGATELIHLAMGNSTPRRLFVSAQVSSPLGERIIAFATVALIMAGLVYVAVLALRRRLTFNGVGWFLLLACLTYPLTLALRLTTRGSESANRTSEFIFIALGLALAVAAARVVRGRRSLVAVAAACATVVAGGIVIGWARWARLPGPYLVAGDPNAIEPQGIEAAKWMLRELGPGHRLAVDRTNGLEMGSPWGMQRPVSGLADNVGVQPLLLSYQLDDNARSVIRRGRIQYVVTDRRLTTGLPYVGAYVEVGEPPRRRPISPRFARKFDDVYGADRIFDSGRVQIYSLPRGRR